MDKYPNLRPFSEIPTDLHRELSARGGKASGEKRRRKALLRALMLQAFEDRAVADGLTKEMEEALAIVKQREKRRQVAASRREKQRTHGESEAMVSKEKYETEE